MSTSGLISAAILCGGRGRRMGGLDKSALMIDGQSVLSRQLAALRPLTPHVMLVGRASDRPAPPGVAVHDDSMPDCGPLGGIITALEVAPTDRVLVLACDLPFVTTHFLSALANLEPSADALVPRDEEGRYAICAVFHRRVAPALRVATVSGTRKLQDALGHLTVTEVPRAVLTTWDGDGRLLLNLNTPQDYRAAEHVASAGAGA